MNSRYPFALFACLPLLAYGQCVEPVQPSLVADKLGETWHDPTVTDKDLTRLFGKISFYPGEPESHDSNLEDMTTSFVSNEFVMELHNGFRLTEHTSLNVKSGLKYRLNNYEYLTIGHMVHHALGIMYSRSF